MNILIDGSQFPLEKTGVGVYAVNLIHALVIADRRNRYTIVIQDDENAFDDIVEPNVKILKYPARIFRKFFFRLFLEQIVFPYLTIRFKIDVIHSLHYSFPLITFGCKRIVTVHDMTFFMFPEVHERFKIYYFRFFILMAARTAHAIITDSESTRRDFIARTDATPGRVTTVLLGKQDDHSDNTAVVNSPVRRKLGISDDYILFIGTVEPRKNLFRLILAFARLSSQKTAWQLVIIGQKGWGYHPVFQLIQELEIADNVIFTGYVGEDEKLHLLQHATVFVYPSLYEGFGLPLLEALSMGVPAITSNISSLPEVAGSGAIQVDPYDTSAIYEALRELLSDKKMRTELAVKAKAQSRMFCWQKTAEKTIQVYEAVGR